MMTYRPSLRPLQYEPLVRRALEEDLGRAGDLTTDALIDPSSRSTGHIVARESGIVAGLHPAISAFRMLDDAIEFDIGVSDGTPVEAGTRLATVCGATRTILSGERVSLNLLGRLCGIATTTGNVVEACRGTAVSIVCTRKTVPGFRALEKYAVRMGGGGNHRFGLDDGILIKDNHIAAVGGIEVALERVKRRGGHMVKVEIEVDTIDQLDRVLSIGGVDAVLLDNMDVETLHAAVARVGGRLLTEASGGITPATAAQVAATGVDLISLGWLTHSVRNLDVGLDLEI